MTETVYKFLIPTKRSSVFQIAPNAALTPWRVLQYHEKGACPAPRFTIIPFAEFPGKNVCHVRWSPAGTLSSLSNPNLPKKRITSFWPLFLSGLIHFVSFGYPCSRKTDERSLLWNTLKINCFECFQGASCGDIMSTSQNAKRASRCMGALMLSKFGSTPQFF